MFGTLSSRSLDQVPRRTLGLIRGCLVARIDAGAKSVFANATMHVQHTHMPLPVYPPTDLRGRVGRDAFGHFQ